MVLGAALLASTTVLAAGNVVEYVHDAGGNVTRIRRASTSGVAITSVNPGSGAVGAPVTIYGAGFSAAPANNTVKFNGVTATVSAAETGSLAVTVPVGATTGRITVTVGAVTATSPQDFVVAVAGAPTVTSIAPGTGSAGTSVTVTGTVFDPPASVSVKLNATSASATVASSTSLSFIVPAAAGSGRISVTNSAGTGVSTQDFIVPPPSVSAGDIVASLRLQEAAAPANLSIATQGKHGLVLFDGTQGGYYTLQFSTWASTPSNATIAYKIYKPDNTLLVSGSLGSGYRPTIHVPKLPSTGTYAVDLSPGVATLSTNVQLVNDPVMTIDGAPVAIALNAQSQSARLQFPAAAATRLGLGVTGFALTPTSPSASYFQVYKPDGTALNGSAEAYCYVSSPTNPQANCDGGFLTTVAGTYTLVAQPVLGTTGSFSAQLSSEATGALAVDAPGAVALSRVGQDGRLTLPLSAGDNVAIAVTFVTPQPKMHPVAVYAYRPDGSQAGYVTTSTVNGTGVLNLGNAATSGNYGVYLNPNYGAYGDLTVTALSGPLIATTDAAMAFDSPITNQPARLRFAGSAGQNLSVAIQGLTHTPASGSSTTLAVHRPDGTQLAYTTCSTSTPGGRCKLTLANLPMAGTYSIVVSPPSGSKSAGTVTLSADQAGALVAETAVALSVSRAGQNVRYTFSGASGTNVSLELANLATNPAGGTVYLYVYRPSGTQLASTSITGSGGLLNLFSLPDTGTYTVLADSLNGVGWDGRLKLKAGELLTVDSGAGAMATAYPGETPRFRFSGTAGQRIEFGMSGIAYATASTSATNATIHRPDGSAWANLSASPSTPGGGGEAVIASLPSTGTYTIVAVPPTGIAIAAGTMSVSTPLTGTLTIGAAAQAITITRPGQTARYGFSGTAGQLLRLGWSAVTVSSTASVAVSILKPDGTTLSSSSYVNGATGGVDIASLPTTGTYTVVLDPGYAATGSGDFALATR